MSNISSFASDPLHPEYEHTIRPLTPEEHQSLTNKINADEGWASRIARPSASRIISISLMNWFFITGAVVVASPVWLLFPAWIMESFVLDRPISDSVQRLLILGPIVAILAACILHQCFLPELASRRCRKRNRHIREAITLGVIHEVTFRCVQCIADFRIVDDDLFHTERIIYKLPSGRMLIAGPISPTSNEEFAQLTKEVCRYRSIPQCPMFWDAVGQGPVVPVEFHDPGKLPRRFRKAPLFVPLKDNGRSVKAVDKIA